VILGFGCQQIFVFLSKQYSLKRLQILCITRAGAGLNDSSNSDAPRPPFIFFRVSMDRWSRVAKRAASRRQQPTSRETDLHPRRELPQIVDSQFPFDASHLVDDFFESLLPASANDHTIAT
jgi:hypothetical protein